MHAHYIFNVIYVVIYVYRHIYVDIYVKGIYEANKFSLSQ